MRNNWIIVVLVLAISCAAGGNLRVKEWSKFGIDPPAPNNMVRLDTNYFIDKTEITNGDWLDYLSWLEYMYGMASDQYIAALPDSVWALHDPQLKLYDDIYLRYPAFKGYPVVGITHDQALAYCDWRANIIFEGLLIESEKIVFDPSQKGDDHFTIERYLNSDWRGNVPDTLLYYPVFELPTAEDWAAAMEFAAVAHIKNLKKCKAPCFTMDGDTLPIISAEDVEIDQWGAYLVDPTAAAACDCTKDVIAHLYGNVREFSADPNVTLGGGWTDTESSIRSGMNFSNDGAVPYIGMRCVARWELWEADKE